MRQGYSVGIYLSQFISDIRLILVITKTGKKLPAIPRAITFTVLDGNYA